MCWLQSVNKRNSSQVARYVRLHLPSAYISFQLSLAPTDDRPCIAEGPTGGGKDHTRASYCCSTDRCAADTTSHRILPVVAAVPSKCRTMPTSTYLELCGIGDEADCTRGGTRHGKKLPATNNPDRKDGMTEGRKAFCGFVAETGTWTTNCGGGCRSSAAFML